MSCGIILCQPLLNILILFYKTIAFEDLGLAIILLTFLIRMLLYPLFRKSTEHQILMQRLQPEIKKIQKKFKNDKSKQGEEMLKLFKKHKTTPVTGIGLIIVQIPIIFVLYRIFLNITHPDIFSFLYLFNTPPQNFNTTFLNLIDLKESSMLIVGLASVAQYFQGKLITQKQTINTQNKTNDMASLFAKQMVFVGPIITFIIFINLPAALSLYWLTTSLISVWQQHQINREVLIKKYELEGIHK